MSLLDLQVEFAEVVPAGKMCAEDLATLKRLAGRAAECGREIRSPQSDSWQARRKIRKEHISQEKDTAEETTCREETPQGTVLQCGVT